MGVHMVPPCMRVQARGGCGPDESPVIDEEEKLMRQTCCRVTDEETSFFFLCYGLLPET